MESDPGHTCFILMISRRARTRNFANAVADPVSFQEVERRVVHGADDARGDGRVVHRRVLAPAVRH